MRNFVQKGDVITVTAPVGGVKSGDPILVGGALFGVATGSADAGEEFELSTVGVFNLPKVTAQLWGQGEPIYFDAAAGNCTTVDTNNTLIGHAARAAANPSATGHVRIR